MRLKRLGALALLAAGLAAVWTACDSTPKGAKALRRSR